MGCKVVSGGFLTTVQDMGRLGYQETGMPVSGVMDQRSAAIANILVDNDPGEAVLEMTMMGAGLTFTEDAVIAMTGADLMPVLNDAPMPRYQAVAVKAGDTLSCKGFVQGMRAYLAVFGGFDLPAVMGSRSTGLKSQIGGYQGRKLKTGDELAFRQSAAALPDMDSRRTEPEDFSAKEIVLRVIPGPQDDAFTEEGLETFYGSTYSFTNESDRMGCRLEGPEISHKDGGDIISDGIVFGAVQVPSHGKPIIMMADHQTTGGYTKIGCVASVDLPLVAQARPGTRVTFRQINVEEAQDLLVKQEEMLGALRASIAEGKTSAAAEAEEPSKETSAAVPALSNTPAPSGSSQANAAVCAPAGARSYMRRGGTYRVCVNGTLYEVTVEKESIGLR